jgi:transcriptional regulator with XRE-family HTH domain
MRIFENIIRGVIEESGLKLNTISKTAGISHTYLTKLVKDNINRPGKDKIASIMLSLNYSIDEINTVLAGYDYQALDDPDIPEILENNRKRKIQGNTLSLYDDIHVKLLLSPMERMGGTKILVKKAPSVLFMPEELYLGHKPDTSNPMMRRTKISIMHSTAPCSRNARLFSKRAVTREPGFETYICRNCLEDYVKTGHGCGSGDSIRAGAAFFRQCRRRDPGQPGSAPHLDHGTLPLVRLHDPGQLTATLPKFFLWQKEP